MAPTLLLRPCSQEGRDYGLEEIRKKDGKRENSETKELFRFFEENPSASRGRLQSHGQEP